MYMTSSLDYFIQCGYKTVKTFLWFQKRDFYSLCWLKGNADLNLLGFYGTGLHDVTTLWLF